MSAPALPDPVAASSEGAAPPSAGRGGDGAPRDRAAPVPVAAVLQPEARRLLLLGVVAVVILWLARSIIGPFVIAGVLAYAFAPLVTAAARRTGLPRAVIALAGYAVAFGLIGAAVWVVGGRLVEEADRLGASGPESLVGTITSLIGGPTLTIGSQHLTAADIATELQASLTGLVSSPGSAIHIAGVAAEIALQAFLVVIVSFYLVLDGARFGRYTLQLLQPEHRERGAAVADRIHEVLGRWLRGQLLLIGLVAVVVYLLLGPILHLPYALATALLTGVLEIIPLVGPMIAAAIAVVIALTHGGPPVAAIVLVAYVVLRQVEDQVVMPVVIGRAVHLHPVVTIFAVLVGLANWGVLGGLLGVPAAAALNVTLQELDLDRPVAERGAEEVRRPSGAADPDSSV